jgi:hypothetical protein
MKCKLYADLKLLNSCTKLLKNLNIELLETSTPNVPKVVLREEIPLIKPVLYFSLASIPLSSFFGLTRWKGVHSLAETERF